MSTETEREVYSREECIDRAAEALARCYDAMATAPAGEGEGRLREEPNRVPCAG